VLLTDRTALVADGELLCRDTPAVSFGLESASAPCVSAYRMQTQLHRGGEADDWC